MKKISKIDRPRNGGTMTESQYFAKIRSILRNGFKYWQPMQITLKKGSRPSQSANKRLKTEYMCAHCKNWFPKKEIQVDHIVECGSLLKYEDIVPFIKRLTPEDPKSFQLLCKPCHTIKTNDYRNSKKKKL